MKVTINSKELEKNLGLLSKVVEGRASMPILEDVKIVSKEGVVKLITTDQSIFTTIVMDAVAYEGAGVMCVNLKRLSLAVKGMSSQDVEFVLNEETGVVSLRYKGGRVRIKTDDAEPFPKSDKVNTEYAYSITGKDLTAGINRCAFACAKDEVRVAMTGVYLEQKGKNLTLSATDGRIVCTTTYYESATGEEQDADSFIIPAKVVKLLRAIKCARLQVRHDTESNRVQMIIDNRMQLVFAPVEARFPNYRAVIPTNFPYYFKVDKSLLLSVLNRVQCFCNQASGLTVFELKEGVLTITGKDNDFDFGISEKIPVELEGKDMVFGLSAPLTITALQSVGTSELSIRCADPSRPIYFNDSADNYNNTTLIMPMLVEDHNLPEKEKKEEPKPEPVAEETAEPISEETEQEVEEPVEEENEEEPVAEDADETEE